MMAFTSKDGHSFPTLSRQRNYEESVGNLKRSTGLADAFKGARKTPSLQSVRSNQSHADVHKDAAAEHGPAKRVTITDNGGQHSLEAELGDGTPYSSTHDDAYSAHGAAGDLLGLEGGMGGQGMSGPDMGA